MPGSLAHASRQRPIFFVYLQIVFPIEVQQVLARFRQGLLQPPDRRLQVGPLRFHGGPPGLNPYPVFRCGFVVSHWSLPAYLWYRSVVEYTGDEH